MIIHPILLRMSVAYLIECEQSLVLVDTGTRGEEKAIINKMVKIGRDDLKLIFITHAHLDHYGCAAALRRITGAKIGIHGEDSEAMALGETRLGKPRGFGHIMGAMLPLAGPILRPEAAKSDIVFQDGEVLGAYGIEASVLHTPGHTMGSSTLMLETGVAIVGDLLTNSGKPRVQRFFAEEWSLIPKSLFRLMEKEPTLIFTGHGQEPIQNRELRALHAGQIS